LSLEEILTDHAYCEQKAATTCISLIQKYADKNKLVNDLHPLLQKNGDIFVWYCRVTQTWLQLGKQRKDEYVNKLLEFQQRGGNEEGRFLDQMLTMALIEARSCERFKRLSEGLNDAYMRNFYRRFMKVKLAIMHCS
jgi:tRNA-(ms[2]io[6]A)-hydroxylase